MRFQQVESKKEVWCISRCKKPKNEANYVKYTGNVTSPSKINEIGKFLHHRDERP
jgi:hypothetical protein